MTREAMALAITLVAVTLFISAAWERGDDAERDIDCLEARVRVAEKAYGLHPAETPAAMVQEVC